MEFFVHYIYSMCKKKTITSLNCKFFILIFAFLIY